MMTWVSLNFKEIVAHSLRTSWASTPPAGKPSVRPVPMSTFRLKEPYHTTKLTVMEVTGVDKQ